MGSVCRTYFACCFSFVNSSRRKSGRLPSMKKNLQRKAFGVNSNVTFSQ